MDRSATDSAGASRGSLKTYAAGLVLSIALTVASFALVMGGALPRMAVLAGICGAAVIQFLVQLHFFLHLDTSSTLRWNVMALLFTLLIMLLFVGGSIWIMNSLHYRMM